MVEALARSPARVRDGDLETISAPIDFLGVNNYSSPLVAADPTAAARRSCGAPTSSTPTWAGRSCPTGCTTCSCASRATTRPKAIYVTENGAAFPDVRGHDGSVGDPERQAYLEALHRRRRRGRRGRRAAARATSRGRCSTTSSGRGATRSGSGSSTSTIPTLERVPKGSFYWYRDFIAAQRAQGQDTDDAYAVA